MSRNTKKHSNPQRQIQAGNRTILTVTMYGEDPDNVEILTGTVHQGATVIENMVLRNATGIQPGDFSAMIDRLLNKHRIDEVHQCDGMLPLEDAYCDCCGEIVATTA